MTASLALRGALALALGTALLTGCTDHPDQTGLLEARAIVEEGLSYALPVAINAAETSDAIDKPGTPAYRQPIHHPLTVQQDRPSASTTDSAARPAADTLTAAQRQGLLQAYVTANLEFTLLHELSHAIFDEFEVPIFGHEEDAADTLATILMIRRHDIDVSTHESIRLLAVSEEWRLSWDVDQKTVDQPYWDAHALAIQRYYNVNCLLAGANPSAMNFLLGSPELPADRGLYCQREYQQAKQFALWLLAEYGRPSSAPGATPALAIDVQFDPPTDAEETKVVAWLKNNGEVRDIMNRAGDLLAWKHPISVEFASCIDADSYYNQLSRVIVICYKLPIEFSNRAERLLRTRSTAEICANRPLQHLIGEWVGCKPDDVESP
jgi:hypothetical protein